MKYKENKSRNLTIVNQEKMEQLNLQSQKLTIDYFSFNIFGFFQKDYLRKVALYLFESFGFNATFKREQLDQKETFFSSDKNSHEVNFVHYDYNPKVKSFWEGTKVNFNGDNVKYFYNQIKNNQLDRNILDLTKLTFAQIDVNSLRESKITDTNQSIEDFVELSRRRVITKDKRRKTSWEYEETGLVLRVGKRGNSRYYRVYQIDTDHNFKGLKFEFEFKPSRLLKELFMDHSIQHFEHELIKEYYSYSFRSVTLNSPYRDWLLYWHKKFSQKPNLNLKRDFMLKQVIGPSPTLFVIKKVGSSLFLRGGSDILIPNLGVTESKPPRIVSKQLNEQLRNKTKNRLTRNEALVQSIIERAELSRVGSIRYYWSINRY